jgi:hypothetical protein
MREYTPPVRRCSASCTPTPAASTLMAALGIEIEPLDQDCAALTNQMPVLDNGAVSISTLARGDAVAGALSTIGAVLFEESRRGGCGRGNG